jgi:hypothetical protein
VHHHSGLSLLLLDGLSAEPRLRRQTVVELAVSVSAEAFLNAAPLFFALLDAGLQPKDAFAASCVV